MYCLNMKNITWIKSFEVDSLQIYFAASLEIQEELIASGFQVPAGKYKEIETPVPIIYANFRGWLKTPKPITIERVIPPEWLELNAKSLGWTENVYNNKRAFYFSPEEVYVDIGMDDEKNIYFKLDIIGYHLERTSIRGINPNKWNNWAMFYIPLSDLDELLKVLEDILGTIKPPSQELKVRKEKQQNGKEITYYVYVSDKAKVGIPIKYFSLCLGCFPLALRYLQMKTKETRSKLNFVHLHESIMNLN